MAVGNEKEFQMDCSVEGKVGWFAKPEHRKSQIIVMHWSPLSLFWFPGAKILDQQSPLRIFTYCLCSMINHTFSRTPNFIL